jgi:hypothetical protein
MSERVQLSEDMKRLMGIKGPEHGGLPAMFQPAGSITEGAKARPARSFNPLEETPEALEERRGLRMFQNEKKMQEALDRAHKILARVAATVQHERNNAGSRGHMQEKTRAEQYRLDQELVMGMDAITACREAIDNLKQAKKEAKQYAREQRRMGRR